MKTRCIITVWGGKHIAHFEYWCAASLFQNLHHIDDCELHIYTREADAVRLSGLGKVVTFPDEVFSGSMGGTMTRLHQEALNRAVDDDAAVMLLVSDLVFGQDSFAAIAEHIRSGGRASVMAGPFVDRDLYAQFVQPGIVPTCLELASMYLNALTLKQPAIQTWESTPAVNHPSRLQWDALPHGMLERRFHAHPVWLYPRKRHAIKWSADNDLLPNCGIELDEVRYLDDCTKFYCLSPSISDGGNPHAHRPTPERLTVEFMAKWCKDWTNPFTLEFFKQKFWTHDGTLTDSVKAELEKESDQIVGMILDGLKEK